MAETRLTNIHPTCMGQKYDGSACTRPASTHLNDLHYCGSHDHKYLPRYQARGEFNTVQKRLAHLGLPCLAWVGDLDPALVAWRGSPAPQGWPDVRAAYIVFDRGFHIPTTLRELARAEFFRYELNCSSGHAGEIIRAFDWEYRMDVVSARRRKAHQIMVRRNRQFIAIMRRWTAAALRGEVDPTPRPQPRFFGVLSTDSRAEGKSTAM